jgi:DNA repair protein RecO (recombination protein O)
MALIETEALILKNYSLADADKIVLFLTRDNGLVRGVAKGAKRMKSKFGSSLELFSLVSLTYFQKEERELVTIQDIELVKSVFEIASEVEILNGFSYFIELLCDILPPNEPNERVYKMTLACLEAINQENFGVLRLYFEIWLLKLSGYLPSWESCEACMRPILEAETAFLMPSFHLICKNCNSGRLDWLVNPGQLEIIRSAQKISPVKFAALGESRIPEILQLRKFTEAVISRVLGK